MVWRVGTAHLLVVALLFSSQNNRRQSAIPKVVFLGHGHFLVDMPADDGKVYDTDRIMFLRACLT